MTAYEIICDLYNNARNDIDREALTAMAVAAGYISPDNEDDD